MRRARRRAWSAAKVTLVATSKVGVGPGVNTLDHRSSTKETMIRKSDEDWDSFSFFSCGLSRIQRGWVDNRAVRLGENPEKHE